MAGGGGGKEVRVVECQSTEARSVPDRNLREDTVEFSPWKEKGEGWGLVPGGQ